MTPRAIDNATPALATTLTYNPGGRSHTRSGGTWRQGRDKAWEGMQQELERDVQGVEAALPECADEKAISR